MKKKSLSLVMIGCMLASLLTGCGNSGTSETTTSAAEDNSTKENSVSNTTDGDVVNLTMSFWGDVNESVTKQALVDEFNKTHPNIHVEYTFTDGATYPTTLQTYFTSNTAPDIMNVAEDIIYDFQKEGVFENLKPYMEKDNLLDGVWEQDLTDQFTFGDSIICAPHVYKIPAIAYNKDLFDEKGIAYPDENWTDEDFMNIAKQLTYGEGQDKVWGVHFSWFPASTARDMFNNPYYIKDENQMNVVGNDQFKTGLELFHKIFVEDQSAPNDTAFASVGGGFETGKFGMAMVGAWEIDSMAKLIGDKFSWDVVRLPINSKYGRWRGINMCDGMAISSKSENKEAAWEFIKWCTTDESAQKLSAPLGVPALSSYANSEEYKSSYPDGVQKYDKSAFFSQPSETQPWYNTGKLAKINDELGVDYEKYINGEMTIDELISDLDEKGKNIFAE